ncbi:MAG: hypothetical protein IPN08_00620 [Bacteroidales bacterium]|nr:hypothetical protein [Bacteroidales bacterium]
MSPRFKPAFSILLILLLLNPMLVRSLHRHNDRFAACGTENAPGINSSCNHHEHCEICSFDFVIAFIEEVDANGVFRTVIGNSYSAATWSTPSPNAYFSPLRAPPSTI